MKFYLSAILLFPYFVFAQFGQKWNDLPNTSKSPAIIHTTKAKVVKRIGKKPSIKIQEAFTNEKPEFVSLVIPDTLERVKFKAYNLTFSRLQSVAGKMLFKDVSIANIKYLNKARGLFSSSISSIEEDDNGVMYLGSEEGLVKYNGNEFLRVGFEGQFSLSLINRLKKDKDGRIWISTDDGYAYIFKNKIYIPIKQLNDKILGFHETKDTGIVITSFSNGMYQILKDKTLHYYKNLPSKNILDTHFSSDQKKWIAFGETGFGYIKNDSLFIYKRKESVGKATSFLESNDELWIGTFYSNVLKFRNDSIFKITLDPRISEMTTHSMLKNSKGIWFARYGSGVVLLNNNGDIESFSPKEGLVGRHAYSLYEDEYENIWVADLIEGLSRIDENILTKVKEGVGGNISDIELDNEGNIWYFKNGDALAKETPTEIIKYANAGSEDIITSMHNIDGFVNGREVWMGDFQNGLTKLCDDIYTHYQLNDKYEDNSIYSIQTDEQKGVWCKTHSNKLLLFSNDTFYNFSDVPRWETFKFTAILKSNDEYIFAQTKDNGVIVIKGKTYLHLNKNNTLLSNQNDYVFQTTSHQTLFFSEGNIRVVSGGGFSYDIENHILNKNKVSSVKEISKNKFLLITTNGLIICDIQTEEASLKFYDGSYGLKIAESRLAQIIDNQIIIGGSTSVYRLNLSLEAKVDAKPKLSFNSTFYNDTLFSTNKLKLRFKQNGKITFNFNKIFWGKKVVLEYQLAHKNTSKGWSIESGNEISFLNLSDSKYKLNVRAVSGELKSKPITILFSVVPYWYQLWWFKFSIIVFISVVVLFFLHQKKKKAIKTQQNLEKQVIEKTTDLEVEKKEVVKQLQEKELLLKEVNHRVKNNMQMVSNLLELQMSHVTDEKSKNALNEGATRIKALGFAHQKLYQNENFSTIDTKDYLKLIVLHVIRNSGCDTDLNFMSDYCIHIEKAQAIGFILNELITNSIKYAWEANQTNKKVSVSTTIINDQIVFKYADNGKGFPENFDIKQATSLGSTLVCSFVDRQLDGTIETDNNNGAYTVIKFNKNIGN